MSKLVIKTGTLENLTESESLKLKQLSADLSQELKEFPDLNTKWSLLRFLRARNFNLPKTKQMLTNFMSFRHQNDYNRAMNCPYNKFSVINENYSTGYCGCDYSGRLVVVEEVAKSNPEKVLGLVSQELINDYLIQKHERILHVVFPVLSKIKGSRVDQTCLILDLKDFSMGKIFDNKVQQFLKLCSALGQDYYPECLGVSYIINAPFIFKGIWSVVKGMLDERTASKFVIESGNGLEVLAMNMDIRQLPVSLGGMNTKAVDPFNGPWDTEMREAWGYCSFWPKDRSAEKEYFFTKEEAEEADVSMSKETASWKSSEEMKQKNQEDTESLIYAIKCTRDVHKTLICASYSKVLKVSKSD